MKTNITPITPYLLTILFSFASISHCSVKIGAFNIQTFGKAKYSNETLRDHLVAIVITYDLILIQEIKDVSETMIFNFIQDCQAVKSSLDLIVSPRLGRTSYKEQYAIIFDKSKLKVVKQTVFDNPRDLFSRPPIIAHFTPATPSKLNFPDFTVLGAHIDPDDVVQELNEFPAAYDYAVKQGYPAGGLFMGDLNADCRYLSEKEYGALLMTSDDRFTWLGETELDTTVSETTTCFYDRIVLCGPLTPGNFTLPSIDRFDREMSNELAKKISDHYPVYVRWKTGPQNDGNTEDADTSQAISHFRSVLKEFICYCFPVLWKHKHEEWLESAVFFLSIVSILICRRIFGYFDLVIT